MRRVGEDLRGGIEKIGHEIGYKAGCYEKHCGASKSDKIIGVYGLGIQVDGFASYKDWRTNLSGGAKDELEI
jgi:hypothetical protein